MDQKAAGISAEALAALVERLWPGGSVEGLVRLSGGATQQSWSFDVVHPDGTRLPLILRLQPHFRLARGKVNDLAVEAALIRAVAQAGVPVPHIEYVLSAEDAIGNGFLMRHIAGETVPQRLIRQDIFAPARQHFARQCGEIMARIHAVPRDGLPPLNVLSAADDLAELERQYHDTGLARPVFDLAIRWLTERVSLASTRMTLVHGDFRNGNLMVDDTGIIAVLDWELARIADPVSDLGWICVPSWRFGVLDRPVGGIGMLEDMLAGYESVSGIAIDPEAVRFWQAMGMLRWGIMCAGMTRWIRKGSDTSVERMVIARRASETELDLMRLINPAPPAGYD